MTMLSPRPTVDQPTTFGSGGNEPYAAALENESTTLYLRHSVGQLPQPAMMDAARWIADADATDLSVLAVECSLAAKATPCSTNPSRVDDQLTVLEVAASAARTWSAGFRPVLDLGLD